MRHFFNIRYELDRKAVLDSIEKRLTFPGADYICVADGVIMNTANRDNKYLEVVNGGMFSICDSSYVPLYIKWIYGEHFSQYCGSEIFIDVIKSRKYRMIFLGTSRNTLAGLKRNLKKYNPEIENMTFHELPFCEIGEFDYKDIASMIEQDGADIIWTALGAPKQEYFMNRLKPFLHHGVMIAVGAAFKFFSGIDEKRAPQWMLNSHLEFVYRILHDPKKQLKRCGWIVMMLPGLLYAEWRRKNNNK